MSNTASNTQTSQRFSGEWKIKRLQDISDINPQNFSSNTKPDYKFNYISLEQVDFGRLLGYSEEVFRTAPSRAQRILQNEDVLMSTVRPNLMGHLFFHNQVQNAVCSTGFAVLRAKHNLSDPYFLFAQLFGQGVNNQIAKILAGSNYPAINSRDVKLIEIPCPPEISEQRAIAEALSDVDGLLNALDALIAKKQAIKQATMQQLLTGKTRLPGFSGAWETKQLGEIGHCLRGVSYDPTTDLANYDKDSTIRLLRANNIQDAVVTLNDLQYVEARKVSEYQIMQSDDILICMANGSKELVGKTGLFHIRDGHTYTFGAFMGCFRVESTIAEPSFVFYLFQTHEYRNFINITLAGSSINNLKPSDIELTEFKIPDRNEQIAITSVLSDMDAEIAALEQRRDKTRAIKQGMMQQLLTGRVRLSESKNVNKT